MSDRERFLRGGGDMGAAIRSHKWSASPLGPMRKWPTALRNTLNFMLNAPESMYVVWGPQLTFLYNDAYRPILGWREPGALGMRLDELWPDAWEAVRPSLEQARTGKGVRFTDVPITLNNNGVQRQTWWSYSYSPIYDGDTVAGVLCLTAETTGHVRAGQALNAANLGLRQEVTDRTAERDRLWETTTDLMGTASFTGHMRAINPAWTRNLGWTEDEILGEPLSAIIHPDDHAKAVDVTTRIKNGETVTDFIDRLLTKDGETRTIMWTAAPDAEPGTGLFHLVGRDMTDLFKAEEALRQSQKMEAVGQLTGGLAHDFNNLLAGISGSLDLMNARINQGRLRDVEKYVVAAQGAAKRAAALTHRLLAFSRRQTLAPKATNVNNLINGMLDLVQRTVGPSITVETVAMSGLWPALVDESQLENALLNLCINARDAMPGGGRITIETSNSWLDRQGARRHDMPEGQYLSLCVSDTGTGMTPDIIAKAFDPFFTTKPPGEGTGLGLSMIYGFAKQSGGQVRIYSEVGEGTTVCIYLPRHRGDAKVEEALPERSLSPPAAVGETVLVVDDEPTVRMLVTDVLEELGYVAIEASDGSAGLRVLNSDAKIDLLVTDVGLPGGVNGRQMADAARVNRQTLKVLFITGFAENALFNNGQLEPGMSVLTKPFAVDTLAARIRELIAK